MISAQPNKPQQEKLIAKLMELPNNAVRLKDIFYFENIRLRSLVGLPNGSSSPKHGCSFQRG